VNTTARSTQAASAATRAASFALCRRIARQQARNFFYGMKLTPEPKRSALYALYAWMRAADDLADAPDAPGTDGGGQSKAQMIEAFRRRTFAGADAPSGSGGGDRSADEPSAEEGRVSIWPAVHQTLADYPIAPKDLEDMIAGQLLDQSKTRYANFAELHDYCYKVAGTVGLTCISIWGYRGGEATRQLAVKRGVALQLTNILRDLTEDARRDRVYLPQEDLDRFGCPRDFPALLRAGQPDAAFDRLMSFQIERATEFYRDSADLERYLDAAGRSASWAIMRIYRGLLERIARDPRRILRERVHLPAWQKAAIALRASLGCGVRP
jgi:phytoene synthase